MWVNDILLKTVRLAENSNGEKSSDQAYFNEKRWAGPDLYPKGFKSIDTLRAREDTNPR